MEIKKNITTQNWNSGILSRIKYIVVHYTGNNGDTALANTNYFKSYRGASAHYFVDENNIYQSIEDKNIAWHCGANSYKHPYCRNSNSLGVELCSYITGGKYAFKPKTVDNAVWLIKELMAKYNVPITNVLRHYDVTGKLCPEPYVRYGMLWNDFKHRLTEEDNEMVTDTKIIINGKYYTVGRILKDNKNYICLKDLEQAGFEVSYNRETKIPTLKNKPKEIELVVDDKITSVEAVNINGNNFVPIRSIAEATKAFDVDYKNGTVTINAKKA
jgi:N-acetylmuramoyl-L-alanine amidase CwlA|nr:MAG TPA: N acetylmuramoyl L alanine amidase endolysin [Caudoviricetes sp.]